jgi:flagellar assembly factor FliW
MSAQLTFLAPPPGLSPYVDWVLDDVAGVDGLYSLRSTDDAGLRLYLLDAGLHVPDYGPRLSDQQCLDLEVTSPDQALVLVVATAGSGRTTMNLMAPIIVNAETGVAAQVILEDQDWPLVAELPAR